MRRAVLDQILRTQSGLRTEGERFVAEEGLHLDLLAAGGHEVVTLPKLREVTLEELYLRAVTEKGEIYSLEYEQVVGVRVKPGDHGRATGRAGFTPA